MTKRANKNLKNQKNSKKVLQNTKKCGIILGYKKYRGIAQLVEYRSPKPWVAGSNPPAPAKKKADCESNLLFSVKSVLADGINPTSRGERGRI